MTDSATITPHKYVSQSCYVCDESVGDSAILITDCLTNTSNTKLPTKIGRIVGDAFMVIVSVDDVICKRCLSMFNHMDRVENDLDRVKNNILNLIYKKYGITNENDSTAQLTQLASVTVSPVVLPHQQATQIHTQTVISPATITKLPPQTTLTPNLTIQPTAPKLQKLNSGQAVPFNVRKIIPITTSNGNEDDHSLNNTTIISKTSAISSPPVITNTITRKIPMPSLQAIQSNRVTDSQQQQQSIENQLSSLFDTANQGGTITLQTISTIPQQTTITTTSAPPTTAASAPTTTIQHIRPNTTISQILPKKSPTKLYKCVSCDFKTVDLKLFQPHYETCKQNSFRCKLCKKVFTSLALLKQHNAEKHASEYTCSICSINYLNEYQFKKHMETNHPNIKNEIGAQVSSK